MSFVRILSACVRIRNWFMVLEMAYIVHLHSVRAETPLFFCFGYVQSFGRKKRLLVSRLETLGPSQGPAPTSLRVKLSIAIAYI
jgi:hypothetical protein